MGGADGRPTIPGEAAGPQAVDIEPATTGAPSVSTSLPVLALVVLGILIAVLGLFAAGDIAVTAVGLVAIAVGGMLDVVGRRTA